MFEHICGILGEFIQILKKKTICLSEISPTSLN